MEETQVDKLPVGKEKYRSPVAISVYGDTFERYHRLAEYTDLLPSFKDWYYQKKVANDKETLTNILRTFNTEVCAPLGRAFHPKLEAVRSWRRKWDMDLIQTVKGLDHEVTEKRNVYQVIKTRNQDNELVSGGANDNELEAGVRTLGGELLNDAMQMLRDDQELSDIYDTDELIKRRNYIVNVFAHGTRLVHGKAALMLKSSEEKRNQAGFLMSLLARASAGKMTDEEMVLLKSAYAPKQQGSEVETQNVESSI